MQGKQLTSEELHKKVAKNLKKLDNSSMLEMHAFFMGKAQLIEAGLKGLLIRKYNYEPEKVERWTLGAVIVHLKKVGVREDFMNLLDDLLVYRNSMAHDFLSTNMAGMSMAGEAFAELSMKELSRGLVVVEQAIHVYDFLNENDCFEVKEDK